MSADDVLFTYDADANPDGAHLPGVPLRDLTQADLDALPAWLLSSVEACPFYRKATKPHADKAVRPSENKEA